MGIVEIKEQLRIQAKKQRSALSSGYKTDAQQLIYTKFIDYLSKFYPHSRVGLYWSKEEELDVVQLLEKLHKLKISVSLPRVDVSKHPAIASEEQQSTETSADGDHSNGCRPKGLIAMTKESANMIFVEWTPSTQMIQNSLLPFSEPSSDIEAKPDLVVAPLLVCDRLGHRIGYGKGYYDRYFANNPHIIKVGFCYGRMLSDHDIPQEEHDIKLDIVITEGNEILADISS